MPAIEIIDLRKSYGKKIALKKVSFVVNQGEIYGFLGPNGAGKTTTIRCIMDFIRPDGGEIEVFGHDSKTESVKVKKLIGFLPADSQLYDKWTGQEHLEFVKKLRGGDYHAMAKRLNFDLSTRAQHLSTGNKQKLALLIALTGQPKLLIMDEPTKGLDPIYQEEIYSILREYRDSGGTVFISSHNLPEVEKICTRVGIIREGELVKSESMGQIKAKRIHLVSVRFKDRGKTAELKRFGEVITEDDRNITLKMKGELDSLISTLSRENIEDLSIGHASLEDVFMEFYKK